MNFLGGDEVDRTAEVYGPNYVRLRQIKAQYDPDNRCRTNQIIRPGARNAGPDHPACARGAHAERARQYLLYHKYHFSMHYQ